MVSILLFCSLNNAFPRLSLAENICKGGTALEMSHKDPASGQSAGLLRNPQPGNLPLTAAL